MAEIVRKTLSEDVADLFAALILARERISNEDWQGTCGCIHKSKRNCICLKEHNAILAQIDKALCLHKEK